MESSFVPHGLVCLDPGGDLKYDESNQFTVDSNGLDVSGRSDVTGSRTGRDPLSQEL